MPRCRVRYVAAGALASVAGFVSVFVSALGASAVLSDLVSALDSDPDALLPSEETGAADLAA